MAQFEPVAGADEPISVDTLVVGGGIAGMTTAIESAEVGKQVVLVEKLPSLGGRVAAQQVRARPRLQPQRPSTVHLDL